MLKESCDCELILQLFQATQFKTFICGKRELSCYILDCFGEYLNSVIRELRMHNSACVNFVTLILIRSISLTSSSWSQIRSLVLRTTIFSQCFHEYHVSYCYLERMGGVYSDLSYIQFKLTILSLLFSKQLRSNLSLRNIIPLAEKCTRFLKL